MPYAKLNDVKIFYEIYGSELLLEHDKITTKPTIVVLHGAPGLDHTFYEVPFLKDCVDFAQVIFIDHRGNGRSIDNNPENWNLKRWAEDVYLFCETLGLEKPFILGESFGGWVAMQYAILHPTHAGGMILIDTESYLDIPTILDAWEKRGGKAIREIAERFYNEDPEVISAYREQCWPLCSHNPIPLNRMKRVSAKPNVTAHFQKREMFTFNFLEELKNVATPVLYLTNTINPFHLYESAQKTAKALSSTKVEFVAFDDCGLVAMDAKDQAIAAIKNFLLIR